MDAVALLAAARKAGVKVTVNGAQLVLEGDALTPDLVASFKAVKPELIALLREARRSEIGHAFAEVFTRLSALYDGDLVGALWSRVTATAPVLARSVHCAEKALDAAALAYTNGDAPTDAQFRACLAWFERVWCAAISTINKETTDVS